MECTVCCCGEHLSSMEKLYNLTVSILYFVAVAAAAVEVKKESPQIAMSKEKMKNDSDSEDDEKKNRQRFKSERPKEQHKIEKHEPSMLIKTKKGVD